jgi:hypothetical protein
MDLIVSRMQQNRQFLGILMKMANHGYGQLFTSFLSEIVDEGYDFDLDAGEYAHFDLTKGTLSEKVLTLNKLGNDLFVDLTSDELLKSHTHVKMVDKLIELLVENGLYFKVLNPREKLEDFI